jgi:hypothetical protein
MAGGAGSGGELRRPPHFVGNPVMAGARSGVSSCAAVMDFIRFKPARDPQGHTINGEHTTTVVYATE